MRREPSELATGRLRIDRVGLVPALAVAVGVGAAVLYVRTMLPGVSVGDWAEMQMVPARLDVPHPTGYPLYVFLGWLFSLMPIGSYAWRATLLSAVAAAAAVAMTVPIATRLGVRPVLATIGAATLAVTGTLWQEGTFSEMNSLHLLLMALVVHRALVFRDERRDRDLLLGALFSGLAMANHLLAATAVPIVIAFVLVLAWRRLAERPSLILAGFLLFLVGIALYAFIPLRALVGPPDEYASLLTWDGFSSLVTGAMFRQDMHFLSTDGLATAWASLPGVVDHVVGRSSAILLVVGGIGALVLLVRDRWAGLMFIALVATNVYLYANYLGDLHHYLLLTWLILVLWAVVATEHAIRWLRRRTGRDLRAAEIVVVAVPILILVGQWPLRDQSENRVAEREGAHIFSLLPSNAILLTYWDTLTTLSYQHCMEGVRPDVALIAYDRSARVTCDRVDASLDDLVGGERPVFALFARDGDLAPLRQSYRLRPGPNLPLSYGHRELTDTGTLYRLDPPEASASSSGSNASSRKADGAAGS